MTWTRESKADPVGAALIERELSDVVAGVRDSAPLVALMRAGNGLATALDCGGCSGQMIQQLLRAWERALFAAARGSDRQPDSGPDGCA